MSDDEDDLFLPGAMADAAAHAAHPPPFPPLALEVVAMDGGADAAEAPLPQEDQDRLGAAGAAVGLDPPPLMPVNDLPPLQLRRASVSSLDESSQRPPPPPPLAASSLSSLVVEGASSIVSCLHGGKPVYRNPIHPAKVRTDVASSMHVRTEHAMLGS